MVRLKKKGSLIDFIFMIVALLAFSFMILIGFTIYSRINDEFQTNSDVTARARTASQQVTDKFTGVLDNSFLFLTFGLAIVAFVLAALVRVHPIFFVFFLILLAFIIFLSAVFSNIYQQAATNSALAPYASQLTFVDNIMNFLPLFVAIMGTILAIVMFKTWQADQID